ncbi:hypothetical protein FQR65_LT13798 [Abscondita terminalis]|nr:hypothetical protein FQR65_LT04327 [Abscondita terminalis]KAF5283674.1 hypothetical protein FQR65_LT13798 [Abscondita terminalis]
MEELIEEVRKYTFLYDVQNKDYRDQKKRQEAWEEIAEKTNKNWQECRDGWTKLRNAYTNALKRRKTTSGQAAKKIMKWKFEDQMSFLSPCMEPRTSQNSFESQNEVEVLSQRDDNDETHEDEEVDGSPAIDISSTAVPAVPINNENSNVALCRRTPLTKKKIEKSMTELVDIMKSNNRLRSQQQSIAQNNRHTDEIDLFFQSLARTVKKLPQEEQVKLKIGLGRMVFEAELRNISSSTQPPIITTIPRPSPVASSSANSYSTDNEIFVQSPPAQTYYSYLDENLQSASHCSENTNPPDNFTVL